MSLFPLGNLLDTLSDNISKALRIKGEVSVVGSLAQVLKEWLNQNQSIGLTGNANFYGETRASTTAGAIPVDVSKFRKKLVVIKNNYDVAATINIYGIKTTTPNTTLYNLITNVSVPAGSVKVFSEVDTLLMNSPIIGIVVGVYIINTPTTGSVDITIIGGVG